VPVTRSPLARAALPVAAVLLAVAGLWAMFARREAPSAGAPVVPGSARVPGGPVADPFAWTPEREGALVARAARGTSHGLYVLSPGGVEASAARTARWRGLVNAAARSARVSPDVLEGLVLLESAGRPDAVTPAGLDGAVGLGQILAQTGRDLLGMHVDVAASRRLTARIARAAGRGERRRAGVLRRRRAQADQRFDPRASLEATARYLSLARARFGRADLAVVSYHMGMGNLEGVLRAYAGRTSGTVASVVRDAGLSYAHVYFDSSPTRHASAWGRLAAFGDDSANYLWKVLAGREIMRLWRSDRAALRRRVLLQNAAASAEQVLHPPGTTPRFADPQAVRRAWDDGTLVALPDRPALTGLRVDPRMGAGTADPPRYRALRPQALAMALYIGAQVRALGGTRAALTLTSSVSDARSAAPSAEGPSAAGMHAAGWAFDIARRYASPRQAQALQFVLDRLQALDAIAWERAGRSIHVTAGAEPALLGLVRR
jgi:hypothetical protein